MRYFVSHIVALHGQSEVSLTSQGEWPLARAKRLILYLAMYIARRTLLNSELKNTILFSISMLWYIH